MNTAETRPTVILLILSYLETKKGVKDDASRLVNALSPPSLGGTQTDVNASLDAAVDLRLVTRSEREVRLAEHAVGPVRKGEKSAVALLREAVLDEPVNTAEWGDQAGARDLTNALAWYLTFSADTAPVQMEGAPRSAERLQTQDFGPRQSDEDEAGWPIRNRDRWRSFEFWACGLGFAWVSPAGTLVPDPTPAVRDALLPVFRDQSELAARDFVDRLARQVPVLDYGRYRQFIEQHWQRQPDESRLTAPLSEALDRLGDEGRISFADRADSPRLTRADGTTFSHVTVGANR